jgi:chromosome segregation ATPase
MKKLFAITLSLSLITLFAFQNNDNATNDTPSVKQPFLIETTSDTTDLDEEMKKLGIEIKVWENKMKPYEQEMKVWEAKMKPFQDEMKTWEAKMKPYEKQMKELERKLRNSPTTEAERKQITKEMGEVGNQMGDVGNEMGKIGNKMSEVSHGMSDIGGKMGEIGTEMGKIGTKMGVIGTQMEKRHKKIFSWFFQELKKDGFLNSAKCSIMMEYDVFIVNGQSLGKEQFQKYKLGIENRLGKPLKADFSLYFKGTISNLTESGFDFDGNMNSNY